MTSFFLPVLRVAGADLTLLRRSRMLRLAVLAVSMVPAIYALIYLSSVWDPNAKTSALPVALVNLDKGIHYQGRDINVGSQLGEVLIGKRMFGWQAEGEAESARQAVATGQLAFAVIIPADFSAQAVPGAVAGGGKIRVILSEGNNYSSAGFARRFAAELGHQVNETLNEKRWELVLSTALGSQQSLTQLKSGMEQVRTGSKALAQGAGQYSLAAVQVAGGFSQVASGVRTLEARLPADADLKALASGSKQLLAGQRELGAGLEQLQGGAARLTDGARQMQTQGAEIPFYGSAVAKGAGDLVAGASLLGEGLGRARDANNQLDQGAKQLDAGVASLTEGLGAMSGGVRTMAASLPADDKLDAFAAGGKTLASGADHLYAGIKLLDAALPATIDKLDGSARGLADSVEPELENLAPVPNNGSAFAPNMVAVALWIGAVMAAYLFNLNLMPASLADAPRLALATGKCVVPAGITALQTALAYLMLVYGLGVQAPSSINLLLTMVVASWVFLAMLFALLRVFGEASKLLAVLLLTLQLAAGGGVIPVELSGGLFQTVHPWLPFTWVVKAFRASLFGAYDHGWAQAWGTVILAGGAALLLAAFVGRWRVVPDAEYRPGIEI
jgi:putative membrane protein